MSSADLTRTQRRAIGASASRFGPGLGGGGALQATGVVLGLGALAVLAGYLVGHGDAKVLIAILLAVSVMFIALTPWLSAPLIGVFFLLVMNGVPGVDLGGRISGSARVQDVAVIGLALLLFIYRDRSPRATPYRRALRLWSVCFLAWWVFTVSRSTLVDGIPWRDSLLFGRDFLYFGILLPLAVNARPPRRSIRIGAIVLISATVVYAFGQTVAGVTGVTLSWLVHPAHNAEIVGQTRFYSPMNYVVDTCLIFGAALTFSKNAVAQRWLVFGVFGVLALSAIFGLTRANYFGLIIALLAAALVYATRHGNATTVALRLTIGLLAAIAILLLFSTISGGGLSANPIISRITSGISNVSSSSGTFGYRQHVDQTMLQVLGGNWLIGLGFLHPGAHYVQSLPTGSIRNADTGVFNVLMTMGLVGTILIYTPLVYAFVALMRATRRSASTIPRWILYGGVGWVAWAIAGSATLVLLFSVPGAVVASFALALIGWAMRDAAEPASAHAPGMAAAVSKPGTARARRRRPGQPGRRLGPPRRTTPPRLTARVPSHRAADPPPRTHRTADPPPRTHRPADSPSQTRRPTDPVPRTHRTADPRPAPPREERPRPTAKPPAHANGAVSLPAPPAPAAAPPNGAGSHVADSPPAVTPPAATPPPVTPPPVIPPADTAPVVRAPAEPIVGYEEQPTATFATVGLIPLTAVIVTYNSAHCVSRCIASLRTALGDCEILVVDNMSTDGTVDIVQETDARVRVIEMGRNAGFGSASNAGVEAAANDHVILVNPDVEIEDADLKGLQESFARAPFGLMALGLRGGGHDLAAPQTFGESSWWSELSTMALGPFRPRHIPQRSQRVDGDSAAWAAGALMLVRRSEFQELGGFDERFFLYYEDQELSGRYRQAGLPIHGSDAVTGAHAGGQSAADTDQRIAPMAWCLLGWLEYVAMRYGPSRARLSWRIVAATHRMGGGIVEWGASVTHVSRLRRKAEQLREVDALVRELAEAGVQSEHDSCPVACQAVSGARKR